MSLCISIEIIAVKGDLKYVSKISHVLIFWMSENIRYTAILMQCDLSYLSRSCKVLNFRSAIQFALYWKVAEPYVRTFFCHNDSSCL